MALELEARIDALSRQDPVEDPESARALVAEFLAELEAGRIRAARHTDRGWEAVGWVKTGILQAFRLGTTAPWPPEASSSAPPLEGRRPRGAQPLDGFRFFDRDTLPLRQTRGVEENVRIVPGGSSVRAGAHLGRNVVIMPPAYVNIGAWVGEGSMIDSHALVGSCAQVGRGVHLSAGAQLGGVLEPIGLRPVVVEDDAMIGANTGVFEGVLVGRRAVLAPGVNLTAATVLHDLVRGTEHRSTPEAPLAVPEGAVVVPGSRPASGDYAREHGIHLYAPIIVKYRDERTDAATALEEVLR